MIAPEHLLAGVLVIALIVYSLTGGADFGGGVWDLLAVGPRGRAQREVVARAVAPIWEANHVWLILVIVVLFVCFPRAYAAIGTALHVPLAAMLVGIVLRGSAFAFRSHDYGASQRGWDVLFATASVITPFMLGTCAGAVASGTIRVRDGVVDTDFVSSWLAPFPLAVGAFTLAAFAFLAATYLVNEVDRGDLRDDFRVRALGSGSVAAALAVAVLVLAGSGAPVVYARLIAAPSLLAITAVLWGGALAATALRRERAASACAMGALSLVVGGWAWAQSPYLVVPDLTWSHHAPDTVLWNTVIVLGVGSVVLGPAFAVLYAVFKARRTA